MNKADQEFLDQTALLVEHISKAIMRSRMPANITEQRLGMALLLYAVVTLRGDGCPKEAMVSMATQFYDKAIRVDQSKGGEA